MTCFSQIKHDVNVEKDQQRQAFTTAINGRLILQNR